MQECLKEKNVPFVIRKDSPPNIPQARPIETVWTLVVYENNGEIKNSDVLARRIKHKSKELDLRMLQDMVDGVRRKFSSYVARRIGFSFMNNGFCSIFRPFSNKKKTKSLASEMIEL